MLSKINNSFLRFLEIALALHGFLHIFEFGVALYEEAYLTAAIAAFGAIIMLLSALFLEKGHHHHNLKHHKEKNQHNH